MRARAHMAVKGAAGGAVALVVLWFATFHIGLVRQVDRSILIGFAGLHRPRVDAVTNFVAGLCSPPQYVLLVAVPFVVALMRRRPRHAGVMLAIVLGANVTTQILKPLLAAPRPLNEFIDGSILPVNAASWPSGHATAAMSLCLCAVLAAPSRWRPHVGALMAAFAVAVCYSFLELAWHFPSDVLGGFLVASVWGLTGAAVLFWAEDRWPSRHGLRGGEREAISVAGVLRPVGAVLAACGAVLVGVALARPHAVVSYASGHSAFVLGAAAIAFSGLAIAGGASLALSRTG